MRNALERLMELQGVDREILALRGVAERTEATDSELATSEARKVSLQEQIPVPFLALYRRIIAARGGLGAARVQGTICGGCHIALPPQFVSELSRSTALEQCPSCKRILVPQAP